MYALAKGEFGGGANLVSCVVDLRSGWRLSVVQSFHQNQSSAASVHFCLAADEPTSVLEGIALPVAPAAKLLRLRRELLAVVLEEAPKFGLSHPCLGFAACLLASVSALACLCLATEARTCWTNLNILTFSGLSFEYELIE